MDPRGNFLASLSCHSGGNSCHSVCYASYSHSHRRNRDIRDCGLNRRDRSGSYSRGRGESRRRKGRSYRSETSGLSGRSGSGDKLRRERVNVGLCLHEFGFRGIALSGHRGHRGGEGGYLSNCVGKFREVERQ
jgi:hypothetical protein